MVFRLLITEEDEISIKIGDGVRISLKVIHLLDTTALSIHVKHGNYFFSPVPLLHLFSSLVKSPEQLFSSFTIYFDSYAYYDGVSFFLVTYDCCCHHYYYNCC